MSSGSGPVPVALITGYLGSGKTTLLKRIAAASGGTRIAIVMNEFGDIAIDSRVVRGENIDMVELAGGCVCCSLSGEFALAVAEIIERAAPARIVVETTGAAEPSSLAYDIANGMPGVFLESAIAVVDADAVSKSPSIGHTGREQISIANRVIINKRDLVSPAGMERVRGIVRGINPDAEIIEAVRCAVDIGALLAPLMGKGRPGHGRHESVMESFSFECGGVLDHGGFVRFANSLPECIFRAKGFVATERGGFLFDYVGGRAEMAEEPSGVARSELVFIGEGARAHMEGVARELRSIRRAGGDVK